MSTHLQPYTLSFPAGFDEQAEFEAPFRGYLRDVIVEVEDGSRHELSFIDIVRLEQNLADSARMGRPYYAEPGLVILPEFPRKQFTWQCKAYGTRAISEPSIPGDLSRCQRRITGE
jgi:hypothetical protein